MFYLLDNSLELFRSVKHKTILFSVEAENPRQLTRIKTGYVYYGVPLIFYIRGIPLTSFFKGKKENKTLSRLHFILILSG